MLCNLLASALVVAQTGGPLGAVNTQVSMTVFDSDTGLPLPGAVVDLESHGLTASADHNGQATFPISIPISGTADLEFEVTARGRAPIFLKESTSHINDHFSVAMPAKGHSTTPLISQSSGGAFIISTTVDGEYVEMLVDVPAGALPFDASIDVTPYATVSTDWKNSPNPEDYKLGYFHLELRDSSGVSRPTSDILAPITVGLTPWFLPPTGAPAHAPDPNHLAPREFDSTSFAMMPHGATTTYNPVTGIISWDIGSLGIHGVGVSFAPPTPNNIWFGDTNPANLGALETLSWLFEGHLDPAQLSNMPATIDPITKTPLPPCGDPKGSTSYSCGLSAQSTSGSLAKGSNWSVNASLVSKIKTHAKVNTSGAAELLANAELGTSVEFGVTAGGEVGGTLTETITWGAPPNTLVANKCCSGNYYVVLVIKRTQLKLGFIDLGIWKSPMGGADDYDGQLDGTCHFNVGGTVIDCSQLPIAPICEGGTAPANCTD